MSIKKTNKDDEDRGEITVLSFVTFCVTLYNGCSGLCANIVVHYDFMEQHLIKTRFMMMIFLSLKMMIQTPKGLD